MYVCIYIHTHTHIYMGVLGLCCCAWGFSASRGYSSCGVQASHCGGFSCCRTRTPGKWAQQLRPTGLVARQPAGSSQSRGGTCVPYIGRWFPTTGPPGNSWIVLLFRYGEVSRPGDDCHGRDRLLYSFFPSGRGTSLHGGHIEKHQGQPGGKGPERRT